MSPTRRKYLSVLFTASMLSFAGCVADDEDDDTGEGDTQSGGRGPQLNGQELSHSFPMELYEPGTDSRLAEVHWHEDWQHWHRMPLTVPLERWKSYELRLNDPDLESIPLGADERFALDVRPTESTPESLVSVEVSGSSVNIRGQTTGTGGLVFRILDSGKSVYTSPPLTIEVAEAT